MRKILTRIMLLSVVAGGMSAASEAQTLKVLRGETQQYQTTCMSENGTWLGGNYIGGISASTGFMWKPSTDEVVGIEDDGIASFINAVSENGIGAGYHNDQPIRFQDGKIEYLAEKQGSAEAISSDGQTIAGHLLDESGVFSHACVWKNGQQTMLPEPTEAETGYAVMGTNVKSMSADGMRIVGYIVEDMGAAPGIVWNLVNDEWVIDLYTKDLYEPAYGANPYYTISPQRISANGEWISHDLLENNTEANITPMGRYNMTSRELFAQQADAEIASQGVETTAISNSGTMLGFTSVLGKFGRKGLIWLADGEKPMLLSAAVPNLAEQISAYDAQSNTPTCISANGRYIAGFAMNEENGNLLETYLIDMGETSIQSRQADGDALFTVENGKVMLADEVERIEVFDLSGKTLLQAANGGAPIELGALCDGVCVIKVVSAGRMEVKKAFAE